MIVIYLKSVNNTTEILQSFIFEKRDSEGEALMKLD